MFSLAIPTLDRYDKYLSKFLPRYIANDLIDEIVICDENGNDVQKIKANFNSPKLKLYVNNSRLKVFRNKRKAALLTKNKWVAIVDSDNFANLDYFQNAKRYIDNNIRENDQYSILAPCYAMPNFLFHWLAGEKFDKSNFLEVLIRQHEKKIEKRWTIEVMLNMMNGIYDRKVIERLDIEKEKEIIDNSPSIDSVIFNMLAMEQLNAKIHCVPGLEYEHNISDDSFYLTENSNPNAFSYRNKVIQRFYNFIFENSSLPLLKKYFLLTAPNCY